jgi:hypothetical protein
MKRDKSNREREKEGIFGKTRYGTLLYYFSTQPPTMAIKRIKKRKKHFNPSLLLPGRTTTKATTWASTVSHVKEA